MLSTKWETNQIQRIFETKLMNILEEADQIINQRSEEKERQYGPLSEGMDRMAMIFNGMTGLELTGEHMLKALIALKLSRESYNHREDNLLDCAAYIGGLNNYHNDNKNNESK